MWVHLCDSCGVGPHVYGSCPGPKLEQLETTFLTIIYTFWPLQNHISSTLSFGCWALRGGNVPTWLGQEGRWMGAGKVPIMVKKGTFLILNLIVWLDELCVPMQIYSPTQWSQYNAIRVKSHITASTREAAVAVPILQRSSDTSALMWRFLAVAGLDLNHPLTVCTRCGRSLSEPVIFVGLCPMAWVIIFVNGCNCSRDCSSCD